MLATRSVALAALALTVLLGVSPAIVAEENPISIEDWAANSPEPDAKKARTLGDAVAVVAARDTENSAPEAKAKAVERPEWTPGEARVPKPRVMASIGSDAPESNVPLGAGEVRSQGGQILELNTITLELLYEKAQNPLPREQMRVSLMDCVRIALAANPDILVAEYLPLRADGDVLTAQGEFDPVLGFNLNYSDSETVPSSQTNAFIGGSGFGGSGGRLTGNDTLDAIITWLPVISGEQTLQDFLFERYVTQPVTAELTDALLGDLLTFKIENRTLNFDTSVGGILPYGTQYRVAFTMVRDESTFSDFESEYSGGLAVTLTQPLLRGRGKDSTMFRVRTAKNNRLRSEEQLRQQMESTLAEVVRAYWDLVGSIENVRVRQESLDNATRVRKTNERRLEVGAGAALEVEQAKASEATRLGDLIAARAQVGAAEDRLKNLLDLRDGTFYSTLQILPTDRPNPDVLSIDEESSIRIALENRPEIEIANLDIANANLDVKRANRDMLPQVDLTGSYFRGARGGNADDVFDGVRDPKDKTWSVGIQGSVPIRNRSGRGQQYVAQKGRQEASQRYLATESNIVLNVRDAVRTVSTNRITVETDKQARKLQEINVAAEEKKLNLGVSTSFEVLRVQEDLTLAQVSEIQSLISLQKSMADLSFAEGVLLDEFGIEFERPEQEEVIGYWDSVIPGRADDEDL